MSAAQFLPCKDRAIAHARHRGPGGETEFRIIGNPGLVLVVQKPNRHGVSTRSFRVYYTCRSSGKSVRRKIRIGRYPNVGLSEARKHAAELRHQVELGGDPAGRESTKADISFGNLVAAYLDDHKQLASFTEIRRELMKDAVRVFGPMPACDLTAADIDRLARSIADRGAPAIARRTIARIKAIYNYAILDAPRLAEEFRLSVNPAQSLGRRRRAVQQYLSPPRTRVLSDPEIFRFWGALETSGMLRCSQIALQLVLVTGQRPGEIRRAHKSEFQLECAVPIWTIPEGHSKNGRSHFVPLTALSCRLVRELCQLYPHSPLLLPRPDAMNRARNKTALPTAMKLLFDTHLVGLTPATPHDLRRSFATGAGRPKVTWRWTSPSFDVVAFCSLDVRT